MKGLIEYMAREITARERYEGALLGFVIGDAFGHPVRTMEFSEICERFEKHGCLELAVSKQTETALFTDATQMMLFTADGIIWADREAKGGEINYTTYVFYAYQYWLFTQTNTIAGKEYAWLFDTEKKRRQCRLLKAKGLYKNRYLDNINIEALLRARDNQYGRLIHRVNDNAGNGGLKRVLPAGLYFNYDSETAFRAGADFAAITHTSPTGYLSAGCYCAVVAELMNGESLENAINISMRILKEYDGHGNVSAALDEMLELLGDDTVTPRVAVSRLGDGKSAESALAIALFCVSLHNEDFANTIRLAVNHDGESDVCAALCGGLFGAYRGVEAVPKRWIKKIQYYNLLLDVGEELFGVTVFREREPILPEEPEEKPAKSKAKIKEQLRDEDEGYLGETEDFKFE
ncbi:MAG: ADP-ribosylglycohydrolase family protein [Oscillospiraceae bacterium]|nr:ADP-ribosylglycohydrolase family protein [Oscillospiraceae bacterium]